MKTIHPRGLVSLIAEHTPLDLIDVRPRKEFDAAHIPGARSIPLSELHAAEFLRERRAPAAEPVYVICRNRALAGLASGALEGAGCINAAVVDGGMENWEVQGLPIVRKKWFSRMTIDCPMLVLIAGFGFGLGLAVHEIFLLVPLIAGLIALGPKIHSFAERQMREDNIVHLVFAGPLEDWTISHASRLSSDIGNDFFSHSRHRIRFAKCH